MSTDTAVEDDRRRILRFALGITISVTLAMTIEWPLAFVAPIFVGLFLGPPALPLPAKAYWQLLLGIAMAFGVGVAIVYLLLPYMWVCLIAMTWLLFLTFYRAALGMNAMVVLMLLVAILMFPALGLISRPLAVEFAWGFLISTGLGLLMAALMYSWIPQLGPLEMPPKPDPLSDAEAARRAALSTLLVVPLFVFIFLTDRTSDLLVLVFVAVLSQDPDLHGGIKAGAVILLANLIGGVAALVFYQLLVAVPQWTFFVALMAITSLLFAEKIFLDPKGKIYASAFTTFLVIICSTTGSSGGEADAKFITRLLQVSAAAVYMVGGCALMTYLGWLKAKPQTQPQPQPPSEAA